MTTLLTLELVVPHLSCGEDMVIRKTFCSVLILNSITNTFLLGPENDANWHTGNSLYFNLVGGYIGLLTSNHSAIQLRLVVLYALSVCVNPGRDRARESEREREEKEEEEEEGEESRKVEEEEKKKRKKNLGGQHEF